MIPTAVEKEVRRDELKKQCNRLLDAMDALQNELVYVDVRANMLYDYLQHPEETADITKLITHVFRKQQQFREFLNDPDNDIFNR